jgi:hypothetical protein
LPGIVAGVLPWSLTHWRAAAPLPYWTAVRVAGAALIIAGIAALLRAFARFVREGDATPAPVTPPSGSSSAASTGTCAIRCTSP